MSVSINMTITNAGFQAIFNANNTGVELNLTHLQLGNGQRTTDKSETTLVSPIQFQAITAAERPSLNQVRMSAVFPITQTYDICEIGIWAGEPGTSGSVLFAYWASPDGKLVTTAPGVDFVFTHDMTMDQSVADSINVVIDPNASSFLSLLNLHLNDAGDPHSQYLKKTDFSSAVIALQEEVSNNTSGSFTSHTNATDPHPQYTTDTEAETIAASAITLHTSETNPHNQYALTSHTHNQYALTSHTHSNATEAEDGLMSANDKTKLNGISAGATAYTHPAGDGNLHVPATGTTNAGMVLKSGATAGSLSWSTPLNYFSETKNDSTPNITKPTHAIIPAGVSENIDISFSPKGSGSITSSIPDDTEYGGEKRGDYAVDFQILRSEKGRVASGFCSVISGGRSNSATSNYSSVLGGLSNTATGVYSSILGGWSNNSSGQYSAVSGGQKNSATGSNSASIAGYENSAQSSSSSTIGGYKNIANGSNSSVIGGNNNVSDGENSIASGRFSDTRRMSGSVVYGFGKKPNEHQVTRWHGLANLIPARENVNITANGFSSTAYGNILKVMIGTSCRIKGYAVAINESLTACKEWKIDLLGRRTASNFFLVGKNISSTFFDAGASNWTLFEQWDSVGEGIVFFANGSETENTKFSLFLEVVEVGFL